MQRNFLQPFRIVGLAVLGLLSIGQDSYAADRADWNKLARQTDDWYRSAEGRTVAVNLLSHQSPRGSWPKNQDSTASRYKGDRDKIQGTFDNGATVHEVRFLARAFRVTADETDRAAVIRAIDDILNAQYSSGGWPQSSPPGKGYARHITFNDDTMVNLMELLREVSSSDHFDFVDQTRRERSKRAFNAGVTCILKCQIIVNGKKTVWCAQHDEVTLEPRPARTFEIASFSGAESASILNLLMSLDQPSPEVVEAVNAGVRWFETNAIHGIRQITVDGDKRIVDDPSAPPLWARFYELDTTRPIFCSRDGIPRYSLAEISHERRNGYAWYVTRGTEVLKRHAAWVKTTGKSKTQ